MIILVMSMDLDSTMVIGDILSELFNYLQLDSTCNVIKNTES
ncbi:hypothetical protein Lalb_Chr21g0315591 [Lupinus albus]|uniref:Uncharacterized protein n=1 Tax=Lupinus albus TaxID=3870 RepID=A0A6A4NR09_LUPAL|nr:hypothetical protein Lalb_Chr21g0315591 [Lupinus albus]